MANQLDVMGLVELYKFTNLLKMNRLLKHTSSFLALIVKRRAFIGLSSTELLVQRSATKGVECIY